jgi:hypothetical protein
MSYNNITLPSFNIKESVLNNAEITYKDGTYFLYNDNNKWMTFTESNSHQIAEFYSSYDQSYGDVFVSGLGFGILPLWLCNKPEVTSVTVIEISQDVIDLFLLSNNIPEKMNIINKDISNFTTEKKYNSLLLDHYEGRDYAHMLKDMEQICNKISHDSFWAWSLEMAYLSEFFDINDKDFFTVKRDLSIHWKKFVEQALPNEKSLLEISNKTINDYLYTYCNQSNLLEQD